MGEGTHCRDQKPPQQRSRRGGRCLDGADNAIILVERISEMENRILEFHHEQFGNVRTTLHEGEVWFVAGDVCSALGISNQRDAVASLDDDEKSGVGITDPHGRVQITNCVNEPGLYSLIFRSRKKECYLF